MKSEKEAYKDYLETYYKDTCEFCKNSIVMSQKELNNPTFFGQPTIQDNEYMYKCPECGHVNVRKIEDFTPCYQNGKTNVVFEISDEESQKIQDFIEKHNHNKRHFPDPCQFTYTITPEFGPYSMAKIKVKCNICGEEEIISE